MSGTGCRPEHRVSSSHDAHLQRIQPPSHAVPGLYPAVGIGDGSHANGLRSAAAKASRYIVDIGQNRQHYLSPISLCDCVPGDASSKCGPAHICHSRRLPSIGARDRLASPHPPDVGRLLHLGVDIGFGFPVSVSELVGIKGRWVWARPRQPFNDSSAALRQAKLRCWEPRCPLNGLVWQALLVVQAEGVLLGRWLQPAPREWRGRFMLDRAGLSPSAVGPIVYRFQWSCPVTVIGQRRAH